jgi:hypothetical protein
MLTLLTAAALATAPAPHPKFERVETRKVEAPCDMPCCKDGCLPCCEKTAKKHADEPAGHGGHDHDH